ncbi:MIP18 family protein galla-1-like [Artemia franciscana]|uniref:MIP18 family-like domain-containing protein n=1 Tax=Artemia franciscana TaxID=6661 RepID=A0AA88HZS2_ARTSF|nr:hypothetical protein QYM36_005895 [Artemia franciscana]
MEKCEEIKEIIYDSLRNIQDPEKPMTLEDLNVITEEAIEVEYCQEMECYQITVTFLPTVPHCSLASLIGLCIRTQIRKSIDEKYKLKIIVKKGSHASEKEVNKQINDKERVSAAMENPNLKEMVEACISGES